MWRRDGWGKKLAAAFTNIEGSSMGYENLLFEVTEGIGIVTINRPKALNALNSATLNELRRIIDEARDNHALKALILTGSGNKAFVAGADISEMAEMGPLEAREFADLGHRTFAKLERLEIPTIAAVNGFALGGGCELAMACDLVYAAENAKFGQPEVNLGLIPGFGGTQRLTRRVGLMRAKEMVFTGDFYDARKAKELGLVLEVWPQDQLMDYVMGQAKKIGSKGLVAVSQAKRAVHAGANANLHTANELECQSFALLFGTEDAAEGMKAFVEKRPPKFRGV
jgi:enoyl-CoA hydratase